MWTFCLHSLFRKYGWQFLRFIAIPHPVKTIRAILDSGDIDFSKNMTSISKEPSDQILENECSIIGVGFCLKPVNPPCMSGRTNHDCHYLEHLLRSETTDVPVCCRQCTIRTIGTMALKSGAAFYIMASAQDLLVDLFRPALNSGTFSSGLFVLCRYSLRPFSTVMLVSGIRGWLFPFESGACRDYNSWLLSVQGIKAGRTKISEPNQKTIRDILSKESNAPMFNTKFEKQGNVFYPRIVDNQNVQQKDAATARS